jgi:trehalose 6-phosphate synthase
VPAPPRPIVIASNRGPIAHELDADGKLLPQRGAGGLVTALAGALLEHHRAVWVAAAMTPGDREVAARGGGDDDMRYVVVEEERYRRYYHEVSNRLLWFVHHYLWDVVRTPTFDRNTLEAWDEYVAVNRSFAEALAVEDPDAAFLIQDYQLGVAPRLLRELRPDARIAHFSHTPFAGPTYLRILPTRMREDLLRGMLGADVCGFQSGAWADSFLTSCRTLQGARVDLQRRRVMYEGRETRVRVYPISVEAAPLREAAAQVAVRRHRSELERWRGDAKLLLRVDRLELTKNILRGFLAYEAFLRNCPEWMGRVRFLALLSPSRVELEEYRTYTEECVLEAERINAALGDASWVPIDVRMHDDYDEAVAAYGLYDVLLVNPVYDGMNLVAMEGPILNRRRGALVLSRNAGAYGRIGQHALGVNPFDLDETAAAIGAALTMAPDERERRARGLRRAAMASTPARWLRLQLDDLERSHAAAEARGLGRLPEPE